MFRDLVRLSCYALYTCTLRRNTPCLSKFRFLYPRNTNISRLETTYQVTVDNPTFRLRAFPAPNQTLLLSCFVLLVGWDGETNWDLCFPVYEAFHGQLGPFIERHPYLRHTSECDCLVCFQWSRQSRAQG